MVEVSAVLFDVVKVDPLIQVSHKHPCGKRLHGVGILYVWQQFDAGGLKEVGSLVVLIGGKVGAHVIAADDAQRGG